MDDFDYSVHISDQDWDSFFQACEECDLLQPTLANVDDSGTSDADDADLSPPDRNLHAASAFLIPGPSYPIDGPPDCEGSPVEHYLHHNFCVPRGPDEVLSGSEGDVHQETVNRFFERLKNLEPAQEPIVQNCCVDTKDTMPCPNQKSPNNGTAPVKGKEAANSEDIYLKAGNPEVDFDRHGEPRASEPADVSRGFTDSAVELFIREDWFMESAEEEMKQHNILHSPSAFTMLPSYNEVCGHENRSSGADSFGTVLTVFESTEGRRKTANLPYSKGTLNSQCEEQRRSKSEPEASVSKGPLECLEHHFLTIPWAEPECFYQENSRKIKKEKHIIGDPQNLKHGFDRQEPTIQKDLEDKMNEIERGKSDFSVHKKTSSSTENVHACPQFLSEPSIKEPSELFSIFKNNSALEESFLTEETIVSHKMKASRLQLEALDLQWNLQMSDRLGNKVRRHQDNRAHWQIDFPKGGSCPLNRSCSTELLKPTIPGIAESSELRSSQDKGDQKLKNLVTLTMTNSDSKIWYNRGWGSANTEEFSLQKKGATGMSAVSIYQADSGSAEPSSNVKSERTDGVSLPSAITENCLFAQKQTGSVHKKLQLSSTRLLKEYTELAEFLESSASVLSYDSTTAPARINLSKPMQEEELDIGHCLKNKLQQNGTLGTKRKDSLSMFQQTKDLRPGSELDSKVSSESIQQSPIEFSTAYERIILAEESDGITISTCTLEEDSAGQKELKNELFLQVILQEGDRACSKDTQEALEVSKSKMVDMCKQCVMTQEEESLPIHQNIASGMESIVFVPGNTQVPNIINNNSDIQEVFEKKKHTHLLDCPTPQVGDEEITGLQSDIEPLTELSKAKTIILAVTTNSIKSPGETKDSSNTKPSALPDPGGNIGNQTLDGLFMKSENLMQASTVECSNKEKPRQGLYPANAAESEASELQNKGKDISLLYTSELKSDINPVHESHILSAPKACNASTEREELDNLLDPTHPVYAISSFWDEMEKLTINDILHLRLVRNAQPPGLLPNLQEGSMVDVSDAADSGFFHQADDSKSARTSGDISAISNFEDEFSQTHNASVSASHEPQGTKMQGQRPLESSQFPGVLWESGPYPISMENNTDSEDGEMLLSNDVTPQNFNPDNPWPCSRRMCKNVSVQNLQSLDSDQLSNHILKVTSLDTILAEEENNESLHPTRDNCNSIHMESKDRADPLPVACRSMGAFTQSNGISYPEVFEYLFGENEAEAELPDTASKASPPSDGESLPETYDHFFSEYDAGDFFFPLVQGFSKSKNETVPIFSCSRSANGNLQFPEVYDYFFPDDSPVESENEEDNDCAPIRVVTRFDQQDREPLLGAAAPDMYEHFFEDDEWKGDLFWRNLFSMRRVCLTDWTWSRERSSSWALATTQDRGKFLPRTDDPLVTLDHWSCAQPMPHIIDLESWIFGKLAEQQRRYATLQTAVVNPREMHSSIFSLKQSDMCLICIAFASWVLRSTNPQAADSWKAALLANVSALSAIRYLRRYVREDVPKDKH